MVKYADLFISAAKWTHKPVEINDPDQFNQPDNDEILICHGF